MKKLFSLMLLVMLFFMTGCTSKKLELVEMTNTEKLAVLQEMEMPEYEGVKISLNMNIENTGEDAGKFYVTASSYTNLKADASFLEYLDAEFDVDFEGVKLLGKAKLFVTQENAYLETDASSQQGATTITYKGKEKMVLPEIINSEEILAALNQINFEEVFAEPTEEDLAEMEPMFNAMKVYQDDTKLKVELTINKALLLEMMGDQYIEEDMPLDSMSMAGMIISSLSDDTSIVLTVNMNENIVTSMSVEATKIQIVNEETGVNVSGYLSLKVEMNASLPKVPTASQLEEYQEVEYFSILNLFMPRINQIG